MSLLCYVCSSYSNECKVEVSQSGGKKSDPKWMEGKWMMNLQRHLGMSVIYKNNNKQFMIIYLNIFVDLTHILRRAAWLDFDGNSSGASPSSFDDVYLFLILKVRRIWVLEHGFLLVPNFDLFHWFLAKPGAVTLFFFYCNYSFEIWLCTQMLESMIFIRCAGRWVFRI